MMVSVINMNWIPVQPIWCEIITNVFYADGAVQFAKKYRVWVSSAQISVDSRLISELHSIWILVIQAAYPVDNASQYVRQVHYMRKTNTEEVFAAIADPEKYVVVQSRTGSPCRPRGSIWLCRSELM